MSIAIIASLSVLLVLLITVFVILPLTCVYDLYGICETTPVCNGKIIDGKCVGDNTGFTSADIQFKDLKFAYDINPDSFKIIAVWYTIYNQTDTHYIDLLKSKYMDMTSVGTSESTLASELEKIFDVYVSDKYGASGSFYDKYLIAINRNSKAIIDLIWLEKIVHTTTPYIDLAWI